MSYGGYEYNQGGYGGGGYGGIDPMGGFTNNYDSAMGNAGGFMPESGGKGSDKKQSRDRQSLIPLSVKQVLTAPHDDDVFRVDGAELNVIKLVGMVDNVMEHETNFTFKLNDGSGTIECKQWIEKGANSVPKPSKIRGGALMRIVGTVKVYDSKVHVMVYDANVVEDWNELTYHLLDIMLVHNMQTKGPIPGGAGNPALSGQFNQLGGQNQFNTPSKGGMSMQFNNMNRGGGGQSLNQQHHMRSANDNLNDLVYSAYLGLGSDSGGLHYNTVAEKLQRAGTPVSMNDLMKAVAQLCDDGRLYSTIDEQHYRPTGEE